MVSALMSQVFRQNRQLESEITEVQYNDPMQVSSKSTTSLQSKPKQLNPKQLNRKSSKAIKEVKAAGDEAKLKKLENSKPDSKANLKSKQENLKSALEKNTDKNAAKTDSSTKVDLSDTPVPTPSLPSVPKLSPSLSSNSETSEVAEPSKPTEKSKSVEKYQEVPKVLKKNRTKLDRSPAIFFVGGLELFGGSTNKYQGVSEMAHAVENAESFSWNDKSRILEEIELKHPKAPVILIGHSFGGDTVVEVANELNTLEKGFRRVNLLVTIDSVGMNNDIIPPNVQKNLNIFGQTESYINDGPNVARNHQRTEVVNVLRHEGHTELDDSSDVQFEIIDAINRSLSAAKTFRPLDTDPT